MFGLELGRLWKMDGKRQVALTAIKCNRDQDSRREEEEQLLATTLNQNGSKEGMRRNWVYWNICDIIYGKLGHGRFPLGLLFSLALRTEGAWDLAFAKPPTPKAPTALAASFGQRTVFTNAS